MNLQMLFKELQLNADSPGSSDGATWIPTPNNSSISSINPATGQALGKIQTTNNETYEKIIVQSQKAFLSWREVPAPKRALLIRELSELLRQHKTALSTLVSLEMGKSLQEGLGEVQEMIDMADFAIGQARMLYGLSMHSERERHRMLEQWHPLGIVGVISAFNFPVAVWAWNAFLAVICGNTVIWKPSAKTPFCAVAVQQLCLEASRRCQIQHIFSLIVSDEIAFAENFVDDSRIPLISFTGSTPIGRMVGTRVQNRFGKVILELGGNNAIIVDETANLKLAIPAIVFGAMGTAGQRCTTTRRLFLHKNIAQTVCDNLIAAYQQIRIGDPLDPSHLMGPLIDQNAVDQFEQAILIAQQAGGQILFGGKKITQPGFYVEPTLIRAKNEWEIVQKETFAPILYIMEFDHIEEAIAQQNAVPQGLSAAIFTQTLAHSELFLSATGSDCGIANVNIGTSGAEIGGAFGGEKETGGGREAGSDAWKLYMRRQTCTINWSNQLLLAQGIQFNYS